MATGMEKYTELLKYPVTVFSILLALIAAKYALGIRFGTVSEVGPGGIKFSQEANAKIADLEGRLNGVLVELESLQKRTPLVHAEKNRIAARAFEASQEISDQTAQLAGVGAGKGAERETVKGYIWIGNFKETWGRTTLGSPDTGQPISLTPDKLQRGTVYTTLGNMVVRKGLPANDDGYFQAQPVVGAVARGTRIRIVSAPTAVNREFAVQYWAEIETVK